LRPGSNNQILVQAAEHTTAERPALYGSGDSKLRRSCGSPGVWILNSRFRPGRRRTHIVKFISTEVKLIRVK